MFLKNLFSKDNKILKITQKEALEIEALADEMKNKTDMELQEQTIHFKSLLASGKTLEDIKIEAYATAREAARRIIDEYPYHCQIRGALVLNNGDVAEMATGSGKTLTATMPVYLNALTGKGVHVVTVNEYLAERDSEWMGRIYRFLGLSVGLNKQGMPAYEKKKAFECDITYTTASELGFDYLRDNMVTEADQRVLRELNFALIDEADSILIDDSRTPLIISGGVSKMSGLYKNAQRFAAKLKPEDYMISPKERLVSLSPTGVKKAEKFYNVENLYSSENSETVHLIAQAIKANYIFKKDIDYVVDNNEILIVDPNTGRVMPGREWSDGLHQAVQAKENVPIKEETTTVATITLQNFFRLYNKLAGMTGTAKTEEEEFLEIYNMRVIVIPLDWETIRKDEDDFIFATKKAKYNALVNEVERLYKKGQPVLIGTIAVETSELISKMLKARKIKHEVLNAKNNAREAEIIAKAGKEYAVTVATNMAGRGTDIKLTDKARELGGLAVLGSERHESRRIDNQLRGRSGRQGDPGFSRFFVSLEDDLMLRFDGSNVKQLFSGLGDAPIENKIVSKAISNAQKRVEGFNFDMRKAVLEFDNVVSKQREVIYQERNIILEEADTTQVLERMFKRAIDVALSGLPTDNKNNITDINQLKENLKILGYKINDDSLKELNKAKLKENIYQEMLNSYNNKTSQIKEQMKNIEKTVILKCIDRGWMRQLESMARLQDGIGLRSHAQINPIQAYQEEGFKLFENMLDNVAVEVTDFLNGFVISVSPNE